MKSRLKVQAAQHGRYMEAEARAILASALNGRRPARGLGTHIRDWFAEIGGVELTVPARDEPARATEFDR